VLGDKENCPRGCPSKLSSRDRHSIIQQIHSGRLENESEPYDMAGTTMAIPSLNMMAAPSNKAFNQVSFYIIYLYLHFLLHHVL
jgi:hypothetical protein